METMDLKKDKENKFMLLVKYHFVAQLMQK